MLFRGFPARILCAFHFSHSSSRPRHTPDPSPSSLSDHPNITSRQAQIAMHLFTFSISGPSTFLSSLCDSGTAATCCELTDNSVWFIHTKRNSKKDGFIAYVIINFNFASKQNGLPHHTKQGRERKKKDSCIYNSVQFPP